MPRDLGGGVVRYSRAEIDRMWKRGEIRPQHEGIDNGDQTPPKLPKLNSRWREPGQAEKRAAASAASRRRNAERRAEAERAMAGGGDE